MPKLDSYPLAKPCPDYHTDSSWKELFSFQQNNINLVHSAHPIIWLHFNHPLKSWWKELIYFLEPYIIIILSFSKCFVFTKSKMLWQKQKLYLRIFFCYFLQFSILPDLGKHWLGLSFPTILEIFRKVSIIKIKI